MLVTATWILKCPWFPCAAYAGGLVGLIIGLIIGFAFRKPSVAVTK